MILLNDIKKNLGTKEQKRGEKVESLSRENIYDTNSRKNSDPDTCSV